MEDKLSRGTPPTNIPGEPRIDQDEGEIEDDEGSFVYDVYYRDLATPIDSDSTGAGGSGIDVGSGAGMKRIGKLAGLEDEQIEQNEVDSEEEDADDQDSNEENDYRNDYPSGGESEDALSEIDSEDEY